MEIRSERIPCQFAEYITFEGVRLLSVINLDDRSYPFYRSTGENSQYLYTWFPLEKISFEKKKGYLKKPPSLIKSSPNAIARLKVSPPPPTIVEMKAVTKGEEILVIRHEDQTYTLGFSNANAEYEEKFIQDDEFCSWMNEIKNEKDIIDKYQIEKINLLIDQFGGYQPYAEGHTLHQLINFFKGRYDPAFIEFLYVNDLFFEMKDKKQSPIYGCLGRFGNIECMCISYMIGGGFWRTKESELVKEYITQVYSAQLRQLSDLLSEQIYAFKHPKVSYLFEYFQGKLDREQEEAFEHSINQFLNASKQYQEVGFFYDFNRSPIHHIENAIANVKSILGKDSTLINEIEEIDLSDGNQVQKLIHSCNEVLHKIDKFDSQTMSLENGIDSLKNALQHLLIHKNFFRVDQYDINSNGMCLNFSFPYLYDQKEMLLNLEDYLHFLFKQQPQLFTWELKTSDSPPHVELICHSTEAKNSLMANYAFVNILKEAGMVDDRLQYQLKCLAINQAEPSKLSKHAAAIQQFQVIHDQMVGHINKLDKEQYGHFLFESRRENKIKKLRLLRSLEPILNQILNSTKLNADFLESQLSVLEAQIKLIRQDTTYDKNVLDSKTRKFVEELEKIILSIPLAQVLKPTSSH